MSFCSLERINKRPQRRFFIRFIIIWNNSNQYRFILITLNFFLTFFEQVIKKDILANKSVLIAAHGNSLRALFKYLNDISDEDIINVNIPTGVPLVMELNEDLKAISHHYLGDPEEIQAKMDAVKNQGKK
ncbi:2,3-bisphosphoglycerate-dependent phosphoglycerate mutase [Faecalicoccus pleomorphus]|uniref:2,3-bisphosphoglycerate-dependent phosphoglycerate mutase n=1 Tax=Faecalicoccus pleomorphus TaxID=1323 RepID=A0A7X9NJR7_9FIRM|nr:2,3-bisphosphoglycerate-dependent phosphoglycerate mutase [Faecalicoccus pleomorphus]